MRLSYKHSSNVLTFSWEDWKCVKYLENYFAVCWIPKSHYWSILYSPCNNWSKLRQQGEGRLVSRPVPRQFLCLISFQVLHVRKMSVRTSKSPIWNSTPCNSYFKKTGLSVVVLWRHARWLVGWWAVASPSEAQWWHMRNTWETH